MGIFGPPNIEKLKATNNFKGLIAALKSKDYRICDKAIAALVDIGKPSIEPLSQALKDKNVDYNAAEALGKIADDRAVETLIEALKGSITGGGYAAIHGLGIAKDKRAVEPLVKILKYEYFSFCRKAAAEALGKIGGGVAVEALKEALNDKEFEVRNVATKALSSLGVTLKDKGSGVHGAVSEMQKKEIKCSKCGKIIGQLGTSIADNIRRGGGVVIGGGSLDTPMYQCTICESCGSAFCDSCQKPIPDPCPKCGKSNLRPGFADLVQKYYKF